MAERSVREWEGTPLDTDRIEGNNIVRVVVQYEGEEEILTPKLNEHFGSYDLYDAAHYINALSGRISKGQAG